MAARLHLELGLAGWLWHVCLLFCRCSSPPRFITSDVRKCNGEQVQLDHPGDRSQPREAAGLSQMDLLCFLHPSTDAYISVHCVPHSISRHGHAIRDGPRLLLDRNRRAHRPSMADLRFFWAFQVGTNISRSNLAESNDF
jgi:hypothetical protein